MLLCTLAISAFAILAAVYAQTYTVNDAVQMSEQVYVKLKGADSAGANITALAGRYNTALNLIDQAQRLDRIGDHTDAASLDGRAESILQSVAPEAESLKTNVSSQRLTRRVLVPVEAFTIALTMIGFVVIRRRVRFKQVTEMRVVSV